MFLEKITGQHDEIREINSLALPKLWDNILLWLGFSKRPRGVKYSTSDGSQSHMAVLMPSFPQESIGSRLLLLALPF